jgi:hypothetical protein
MKIKKDTEQEDLRALLKFPQIALVEYSADPFVQRRVGKNLSETATRVHIKQAARSHTGQNI